MNTEEIKERINQFFDNELSKQEEAFLFSQLSSNEEARRYFKEMNLLKTTFEQTAEEFPETLDAKILSKIDKQREKQPGTFTVNFKTAVISVFSVFLLILSVFLYSRLETYEERLDRSFQQINQQQEKIELLYNSLPTIEVRSKLDNEIIIQSKL